VVEQQEEVMASSLEEFCP